MAIASLEGILGATATVIVTTLQDCVWLVPFVVQAPSATTAWIHVLTFLLTFEGLAVGTSLLAVFVDGISGGTDLFLGILGAIICWSLAIFLYVRSLLRRRNQRQQEQESREQHPAICSNKESDGNYGSLLGTSDPENLQTIEEKPDDNEFGGLMQQSDHPQPWLIVTLTVLGSLDEVSYFPALIIAGIFTPVDLCAATLLASLIILFVLCFFLRPCQPLLDFLGRIPLYGIVGLFAILLTLQVIWEVRSPPAKL